jgi:hypothetical protein
MPLTQEGAENEGEKGDGQWAWRGILKEGAGAPQFRYASR